MNPHQVIAAADQAILETERLLHVAYVARRMLVTPCTVRNWIRAGKLDAIRTPTGFYRITATALARLENNLDK